jgi:hypothetical protein
MAILGRVPPTRRQNRDGGAGRSDKEPIMATPDPGQPPQAVPPDTAAEDLARFEFHQVQGGPLLFRLKDPDKLKTERAEAKAEQALATAERMEQELHALRHAAAHPRRRRASPRPIAELTPEQTEAVFLVGEHKGNVSAAARAAGKSPTAMRKLYRKAIAKLGRRAVKKAQTQSLPTGPRGEITVADDKADVD